MTNFMKLLASMLLLGLIGFVAPTAFAEPIVAEDGSVITTILLTPEFEIDTSEFADTGEIILDVIFENTGNSYYGLKEIWEPAHDGLDDPVEVYEKYENGRMFFISIKDVTNEEKQKLKKNQFVVTSNDRFIETRYNENHDNFEVEVLDIDDLVTFTGAKGKIETQLRLSSPELIAEREYEVLIWTDTRSVDPIIITLPTSTPIPAPMEMPKDVEESEKLQEIEIKDTPVIVEEIVKVDETDIDESETPRELTEEETRIIMEKLREQQMIPEPIEKKKCGIGTKLVDGNCEVIQIETPEPLKPKEKGLLDWLFSLFG